MPAAADDREVIRALVGRLDVDSLVDQVAAGLTHLPEYERFVGDAADEPERGRAAIAWNLRTFMTLLHQGGAPREADLERLGDLVGVRAAEGRPPEEGATVYRQGMRMVWRALLDTADERERAALSAAMEDYLGWLDVVSRVFTDVYAQRRDALISQQERRARRLLERIASPLELRSEDTSLADMLGVALADRYRAFSITLPGGSMLRHSELAARLRRTGTLAATEGRRVIGLTQAPVDVDALQLEPGATVVVGPLEARGQLGDALADLQHVNRLAARDGRTGQVGIEQYLPELLALRAPDLAAHLERRVYGALDDAEHAELAHTLGVLAESGFERARAADALPVHRNTLAHRLGRIHAATGLDVDDPDDRGLIWLATRIRRMDR